MDTGIAMSAATPATSGTMVHHRRTPARASPTSTSTGPSRENISAPSQSGISDADFIPWKTATACSIGTHVSRVLAKLGVRDRVQAVALAYESGLVRPGDPA